MTPEIEAEIKILQALENEIKKFQEVKQVPNYIEKSKFLNTLEDKETKEYKAGLFELFYYYVLGEELFPDPNQPTKVGIFGYIKNMLTNDKFW